MDNNKNTPNNNAATRPSTASGSSEGAAISSDLSSGGEDATRFKVLDWTSFVNGVRIKYSGENPRIFLHLPDITDADLRRIADLLPLADTIGVHVQEPGFPEETRAAIKRRASRDPNWSKVVAVSQPNIFEAGVWDVEVFPLEKGELEVALHGEVVTNHRNKRPLVIEAIQHGGVRITIAGEPRLVNVGDDHTHNLSTCDITDCWLSNFVPGEGEDRITYAVRHCSDNGSLHDPSQGCDGLCHHFTCSEPADFFQHWRCSHGKERCIPVCKLHGQDLYSRVGRAVLQALNYGILDDLQFWVQLDPLPDRQPRCDFCYRAVDEWGDLQKARCVSAATKRLKVTQDKGNEVRTYEGKACTRCAGLQHWNGLKLEILGDLESPPPATE